MLVKSQVKYIQSLSQKKQRDKEGVFIAEGPKIINELLQASNIQAQQIFAVKEWIEQQDAPLDGNLVEVSASELQSISFLQTPNQVAGIFKKPQFPATITVKNKITLMLETIQDPGNMGTIIRCADWFGIDLIICSGDSADVFNPKVVQATMGSISRVRICYEDLALFIKKHSAIPLYAATLDGNDIDQLSPVKEGIILIGNESKGISPSLFSKGTHRITIPRKGKAESLNAAVAAGIILSKLT